MDIQIIGTIFTERGEYGDFKQMIDSGEYEDSLFIYNDNEESYYDKSCTSGAGNAIIRRYNKYNNRYSENPLSVGIPTGTLRHGGYESLTDENKIIINDCIQDTINIIVKHKKKRLFYSAKNKSGILGTGIFEVSEDVLKFVTNEIMRMTSRDVYVINHVNKNAFLEIDDDSDDDDDNINDGNK